MNKKKLYIIAAIIFTYAVIAGKKYITFNSFPSLDKWEGNADEIVTLEYIEIAEVIVVNQINFSARRKHVTGRFEV